MPDFSRRLRHPEAIFAQLTTGCNARCTSCPHPFTYGAVGGHKSGNMSSETWGVLIDQIATAGFRNQVGLYLHHEPLLVNDLFDRIRDVNERTDAYVVLSTNGALLDEKRRRALIEARPRTVHINISSADDKQYADIMKLDWAQTRDNAHAFIEEAAGLVDIEVNCPVLPGVDTQKLVDEFSSVKVNVEYWANSRGGLLDDVSAKARGSRFKRRTSCAQPTQNFNVLWDGSVIVCCMDWGHESKKDFPNIHDADLFETYRGRVMNDIRKEFRAGCYDRYKMCSKCADEMGFNVGHPIRPLDDAAAVGEKLVEKIKTLADKAA